MSRLFLIASTALLVGLGACATHPAPPRSVNQVEPVAVTPKPDIEASAYGLFLAGHAAAADGKLEDAADYLGRAAAAEGEPSFLKQDAFAAALEAGRVDEAAKLAPFGDDVEPTAERLGVLVRAVQAMSEGRYKDAYALLQAPDIGFPYRAAALVAPWAAAGAGDVAHAVAPVSAGGDPISQYIADLDQAIISERLGQKDKAEDEFKSLVARGDAGGIASLAYGAFLERQHRWKEAVAVYQAALTRSPHDGTLMSSEARAIKGAKPRPEPTLNEGAAEALIISGAGLMAQKQEDGALPYIRLGLWLDPSDQEAWVLLGELLESRDLDAARQAYAHAKPGSSQYIVARDKLAWTYEHDGDHATALKLARETLHGQPMSRDAAVTLADLLRTNDQYDESAGVLTQLIERPGAAPDWRLYYLRASAYEEAGDWPKAEADLLAALKQRPDEPQLLNFLGYAWIDRGQHLKEALAMVQKAVDANPQSGAMIDSLGWGYYRLGDYKVAVEMLEQAVGLEASDPDVNNHLGDAYWRVGRKIEAQFQWRRVLTLDPDEKLRAQVEAKLASPLGPDAPVGPAAPTPSITLTPPDPTPPAKITSK
jgi:tetratricopeptide (TPR) repeat protein